MEKVSDGAGRGRGGVFKSSDQGESWDPVGLQGTTVHALALDPEHPGTMYAGLKATSRTAHGFQGHPQDDGRRRELARRGPQRSDDHRADAGSEQHRHPLRNDADWAGGVFKNEDGGRSRSWRTITPAIRHCGPARVLHRPRARPAQPCDDLRRHERRLPTGEGAGVSKSLDGGRSWRSTNAGLNGARVSALALAPGSPGTAYAAVDGRGVFKRADGRWRAVNTGLTNRWSSMPSLSIRKTRRPSTRAPRRSSSRARTAARTGGLHCRLPSATTG